MRIIVPSAGGSTTDTLARIVADQLNHRWGKPVVVENISGGGMVVGATQAFRAAPDGYTLLVSPPAPSRSIHLLYRDLGYDPLQFVPVALLARVPNALVVRRDLPAANLKALIDYAKAHPDTLTYGSQGVGSTAHLSASQLEGLAGIKMVHVPYRGAVAALNDVIAGHIDMFFDTLDDLGAGVPRWAGENSGCRQRRACADRAGGADARRIRAAGLPLRHLVRSGCTAGDAFRARGSDQRRHWRPASPSRSGGPPSPRSPLSR